MRAATPRTRTARLVARQSSEMLFEHWQRWQALVPETRWTYVIFGTVLSASIAHLPLRDQATGEVLGLTVARDRARPVNVSAIALSMALSNSSVRRRADDLVDVGLFVRGTAGYIVAPAFFDDDRLADVLSGDATDLMRRFRALADADCAPAAAAVECGVADVPADIVSRLLLSYALRSLETFAALYDDFSSGAIASAIVRANIRHITENVDLARQYAAEDALPPDTVRRPITLRHLSRTVGMPFETVRRRVATMVSDGDIVWRDDGVIVPARVLERADQIENNRRMAMHFDQLIDALMALAKDLRD